MAISGPGGCGPAQAASTYTANQPARAAVGLPQPRQAIRADTAEISPEARRASQQGSPAQAVQLSPAAQAIAVTAPAASARKSIDVLIS